MKQALPMPGYLLGIWVLGPGFFAAAVAPPRAAPHHPAVQSRAATHWEPSRCGLGIDQHPQVPALSTVARQTLLRGIVVSAGGQPCAGASVYATQTPRQVVVTDASGAFALPTQPGTAVSLRIEYFGVGSSHLEVVLPTNEVLHITLGQ